MRLSARQRVRHCVTLHERPLAWRICYMMACLARRALRRAGEMARQTVRKRTLSCHRSSCARASRDAHSLTCSAESLDTVARRVTLSGKRRVHRDTYMLSTNMPAKEVVTRSKTGTRNSGSQGRLAVRGMSCGRFADIDCTPSGDDGDSTSFAPACDAPRRVSAMRTS